MRLLITTILICFASTTIAQLSQKDLDTCYIFNGLEEALKADPEGVRILKIQKHKLKEFPKAILQFKNLQHLDLSKNKIETVPAEISNLTKLEYLSIGKNNLNEFPEGIVELANLKKLILNQNLIPTIPFLIKNLQKLEYLDMYSNDIGNIPESLSELKNLKEADFRVIQFTSAEKSKIESLLPHVKLHFSNSCNCGL